jgi:hypothetical protein
MTKTGWQREVGETVTGTYCGQVVSGIILSKRVAYGGHVRFKIEVPQGFDVFGATRFECLINEEDLF